MPKSNFLQADQSYTFRSYFEMPYEADEILGEFGYILTRQHLNLPQTSAVLEFLPSLPSFAPRACQTYFLSIEQFCYN